MSVIVRVGVLPEMPLKFKVVKALEVIVLAPPIAAKDTVAMVLAVVLLAPLTSEIVTAPSTTPTAPVFAATASTAATADAPLVPGAAVAAL